MLKKGFFCLIFLFTAFSSYSKEESKYSDLTAFLNQFIKEEESFIKETAKIEKSEKMIKSIRKLSDSFLKMTPKIVLYETKYPELNHEKKIPLPLQKLILKWKETNQKLIKSFALIQKKWAENSEISKSIQNFMSKNEIIGDEYYQFQLNENKAGHAQLKSPKSIQEVKKVIKEMILIQEVFIKDFNGASNSQEAVKAINDLAKNFLKLIPLAKELEAKYPEFKNKENLPEELKGEVKKIEEVTQRFAECFKQITLKWKNDADVQKAFQNFLTQMR